MVSKKYGCVLFDMDATLVRTDDFYIDFIFQRVFDELGLEGDLEFKKRLWYSPERSDLVKEVYDDISNFWATLHKYQKQYKDVRRENIEIYSPDDLRALACLKHRLNVRLGIVTGSAKELLDISVRELGRDKFDFITYVYNNHRTKAFGIEHAIERLGVEKGETLYVGNDDGDISSAFSAGVDSCVIRRSELEEYKYFAPKLEANHEFGELSDILFLF